MRSSAALARRAHAADAFPQKAFYRPGEVAGLLDVSSQHVLDLIHAGKLEAVRVSERVYRIPIGSLRMFVGERPRIRRTVRPRGKVHEDTEDARLRAEHRRR